MEYFNMITENLKTIKPSQYSYILPLFDRVKLDEMALDGSYPSLGGLSNAIIVALILGVFRHILTYFLMKVNQFLF